MDPMGIGLFHKLLSHELRTPVFYQPTSLWNVTRGFCFVAQLGMYFLDGFVWAPRKLSKLHTVYGRYCPWKPTGIASEENRPELLQKGKKHQPPILGKFHHDLSRRVVTLNGGDCKGNVPKIPLIQV